MATTDEKYYLDFINHAERIVADERIGVYNHKSNHTSYTTKYFEFLVVRNESENRFRITVNDYITGYAVMEMETISRELTYTFPSTSNVFVHHLDTAEETHFQYSLVDDILPYDVLSKMSKLIEEILENICRYRYKTAL